MVLFFSLSSTGGHTPCCQSVARQVVCGLRAAQSFSFSGGSNACVAGGMIMPPKGSTQRGDPSGRFFGDFLIGEKVTRVQGGAPASGEAGAPSPAQTPRALRPLYKKRIPDACQQIAGRRRHKGAAGRAVPALLLPAGADGLGRLLDRVDHRLPLHPALF